MTLNNYYLSIYGAFEFTRYDILEPIFLVWNFEQGDTFI
jgi:hypothetical protein